MLRPFRYPPSSRHSGPQLGLGLLGRCDPRSSMYFYVVTDAGPASHRVRLWQGGPASTFCRFRWYCCFLPYDVTGTRLLRDRPLGHPDVRMRPWPLRRPRGDGNGGRFVRSLCLPVTPYNRHCPLVPVQQQSTELPANRWGVSETTLPVKTQGRTLDCPFNFRPPRIVAGWFFYFVSPGPSGLMRASEQSVARHTHSLRCESATWVAAQPAVPEAVTRARHSQQCWVSCPELLGPSGLMKASERSRPRQLPLGKAERVLWGSCFSVMTNHVKSGLSVVVVLSTLRLSVGLRGLSWSETSRLSVGLRVRPIWES